MRERKLSQLQHSENKRSADKWRQELLATLVPHATNALSEIERDILRISCKFAGNGPDPGLTISIVEEIIGGICHTHGKIMLEFSTRTDDVNLFDWANEVVIDRDKLRVSTLRYEQQAKDSQSRIESLRKELDELIQAKKNHENEMLAKFAELLNQKKLRIRLQQRQLASQDGPPANNKNGSKSSRKRKIDKHQTAAESESDGEAFEPMDIDEKADEDVSEPESVQAYRSATGSATETEDEDLPIQTTTASHKPKAPSPITNGNDLPPIRSLPFGRQPHPTAQAKPLKNDTATNQELGLDDETASEDDEL